MPRHELSPLSIAVRVYPHSMDVRAKPRSRTPWHCPDAMLVFDTETRTDAAQSTTFVCYRFIVAEPRYSRRGGSGAGSTHLCWSPTRTFRSYECAAYSTRDEC